MQSAATDVESDQVDLTRLTLDELVTLPGASLAPTMARLLNQIDRPTSSIGGYNS